MVFLRRVWRTKTHHDSALAVGWFAGAREIHTLGAGFRTPHRPYVNPPSQRRHRPAVPCRRALRRRLNVPLRVSTLHVHSHVRGYCSVVSPQSRACIVGEAPWTGVTRRQRFVVSLLERGPQTPALRLEDRWWGVAQTVAVCLSILATAQLQLYDRLNRRKRSNKGPLAQPRLEVERCSEFDLVADGIAGVITDGDQGRSCFAGRPCAVCHAGRHAGRHTGARQRRRRPHL